MSMDTEKRSESHDDLSRLKKKVELLEAEKIFQRDEIRALKVEARSYQDELGSLNQKIRTLEEQARQEAPARNIGREVRLRYLERHRQRMGRNVGKLGYDRIKCGDRAAHRGRPLVDALLCLTGQVKDSEVYRDLYGVNAETIKAWKDVSEIVEVTGFRGSLQSEGRLTLEFEALFARLLERATTYCSSTDLVAAFKEDSSMQQLHHQLQDCYDVIVAANAQGRHKTPSSS